MNKQKQPWQDGKEVINKLLFGFVKQIKKKSEVFIDSLPSK